MQVQMPAARRLAQLPDQYADGGLVARMKSADAGPAAFGSRGLSQLRDMVPKMAVMGYPQQAAAPAPAPAPVSNPRAAQLMAMIPQMEAMGFKQQPQMLARGGMVRGPGTGTSDSITTEAEPGTYIMPADSTAAIGPSALEKMGTVPVRLSDGEFKLPPEQVMAIGEAVLKLMKDATHTPVNGEDGGQTDAEVDDDDGARGFNPADRMAQMPQMYADGGMVDPNRPTSFGDAAAAAQDPGVTQIGAGYQPGNGTVSVVPSQPRPAPAPARPQQTTVNVANPAWAGIAQQQMGAASVAAPSQPATGWQARQDQRSADVSSSSITNRPEWRRYADGGMVEDDLQKRLMQIPSSAPAGWNGGGGGSGGGGGAGGVTGSWEAPQAAPAPAPAPTQPAGALTRAASMSTPTPAPAPAAQAMGTLPNNAVTRTGNSYTGAANISGDITVNGQAPGGGAISAQNMAAADTLARRGAADAMASMPNAQAPVQAPTIRTSANDWQSRNDLRNLEVSASSITNNGGRFDPTGGKNPAALAYRAALETDNALRASAPGLAQQAMREQGDTQRAGLQVTASGLNAAADRQNALERTLIGERGANARAGLTTQTTLEAAKIKAQQELAEQQRKAALKNPETSTALRKEFEGLPEVKNYKQALPAYKGIEDAVKRNTPMSDINIVYGIAKLYDPNSVVREGEYATVANAPNIPERVKGWVQYATNGGKLTPEVKKQIMDEASSRMMSFQNEFEGSSARYRDIAERSNADPTLVISSDYKPAVAKKEEQAAVPPQIAELQRRAASNPALAARLKEMGY